MTTIKAIKNATHEEIEAAAFAAIDALTDGELLKIDQYGAKIFFNPENVEDVFVSFGNPDDPIYHERGIGCVGLSFDVCSDEAYSQTAPEVRDSLKEMIDPVAIEAMAEELEIAADLEDQDNE